MKTNFDHLKDMEPLLRHLEAAAKWYAAHASEQDPYHYWGGFRGLKQLFTMTIGMSRIPWSSGNLHEEYLCSSDAYDIGYRGLTKILGF